MKILTTYKSRLILYIALLMGFLVGIMTFSNKIMQNALLEEADTHLDRVVQLITSRIESKQDELLHYAVMVKDNLTLQEYMFVVTSINSDIAPLKDFYTSNFGWLPVEYNMILDRNGKLIAGRHSGNTIDHVGLAIKKNVMSTFAMKCDDGIEMVAYSAIDYLGKRIGTIVLSDDINGSSLSKLKSISGSELFIVNNGNVFNSTLGNIKGEPFQLDQNIFYINGKRYHVKKIPVPRLISEETEMWLGITEDVLVKDLSTYKHIIFGLTITGGILILIVGIILIRDFSRPLQMMMSMTAEIVSGKELPKMGKMKARNEIEGLANQFSDMLKALREKENEVQRAHKKLEKLAITDTLTGLYNRRHLAEIFPKLISQTKRDKKIINVIIFDLDHFKHINDQYGHPCGDQCLVHFANILKRHSRTSDYLFRTGGEEFLLLGISDEKEGGVQLADKIRIATQEMPFVYQDKTIYITVSCGVNCAEPDKQSDVNFDFMLNHADKALYKAKEHGRNRVEISCECDGNEPTNESSLFRN
ncbi:MAG: GGDEF domain-containing protein [Gammaproteobacteria bacterium]|nr:GGDEF domain-containing protein [Gammaproteobacteria bacterium]